MEFGAGPLGTIRLFWAQPSLVDHHPTPPAARCKRTQRQPPAWPPRGLPRAQGIRMVGVGAIGSPAVVGSGLRCGEMALLTLRCPSRRGSGR